MPADSAVNALSRFVVKRDGLSTIIAGYPWFLDWGRDTLIVLRGLVKFPEFQQKSAEIIQRFAAFEKNVEECNLQDSCTVVSSGGKNTHGIVLDLYQRGITGIISDGESAGLKIWNSLNFCNIDIPRQMSLVTWEMPYVSSLLNPAITTVAQNFDLIAEKAIYLLEAQFKNIAVTTDEIVPYQLHMRDTVSIPRNF